MPYRFFVIAIDDDGTAAAELNGFLRGRRVLSVDRHWVDQGTESFWSFCIDYLESSGGSSTGDKNGTRRGKIDYREILSPEDFAVFARLRQIRAEIAQNESIPVYTIFTNEQLAQMVQARVTTRTALGKISGVGEARIDKFGPRMLEVLRGLWPDGQVHHEKGGDAASPASL
jgi:superfamily II DNA helicase RecQ